MVEDIQRSKPIRILHVEDERGALEITKLFLKRKGYNNFKITPILSAEQGLEKLKYESFDLILSDYKMQGMNGLEFLEELRKKGNDIPFIIFTGKGEEKVAMEAINKGANRYIKKEGSPNVLFDTLGQYIQEVAEEKKKERERIVKELEEKNKKQPLIRALEYRDWNVRLGAAWALGKIGDARAIEPLIQAWKGENEDVRKVAEKALEKIQMSKERSLARGYIEPDIAKKIVTSSRKPATKYPKEEKVKRHEEEVMLTPRQIKEIRDLHARGYRDSNIAMWMGISEKSVTKYLKGERVRRIEGTYLHIHRRRI